MSGKRCETVGCENPSVEGGYCRECLDISPKLLGDGEGEPTETPETVENEPAADVSSSPEPVVRDGETGSSDGSDWRACFADAMRYFNRQNDRRIHDHTDEGEHPDRPTTARDYYNERGWTDELIEEFLLGYAPADRELLDHLRAKGYDREAILGTGLFTVFDDGTISQLWAGRYVLPYFDEDGRPVYAISRCTGSVGGGKAGYDGHPRDFIPGKYGKLAHSKEYAHVDEPIFGLESVEDGEALLVAGGIADAISLQQAGYACISPVTTVRFKGDHEEQVVELVEERDIPTVYIVNDNERPSIDEKEIDGDAETIGDALTIEQHGEGLRGAFGDADFLLDADADIDVRFVELPRAGRSLRKTDPDDYIHDNWGALDTVLAAAKPAEQHPGYDRDERAMQTAARGLERERDRSSVSAAGDSDSDLPSGEHSALFDLDIRDVTGRSWGSRDVNPLGHHGDSENYYVLVENYGVGYDHKYKKAYNALTHLLAEAGERRAESPNGRLDGGEILAAWRHAKDERLIPDDDPIPRRALKHLALTRGLCDRGEVEDGWKLPVEAYNDALDCVREEFDLEPGREHIDAGKGVSGDGDRYEIEETAPTNREFHEVDTEQRRTELEGPRLEDWFALKEGRLMMFGDSPGDGKTTSSGRGLAAFDRAFVTELPKHENCREYELDDAKPEVDLHLKGAAQPYHDCCMDAKVAAGEGETPHCPEHGHPADWERMCPIYHLDSDHPVRQRYEALVPEVGPERAHEILDLKEFDWHGKRCYWQQSYDELEDAERVVTVHNYLTQKTVRGVGDTVLDDVQGIDSFTRERQFSVEQLTRAANRLDRLASIEATPKALGEFARFAHGLVGALTGGLENGDGEENKEVRIEALDPPELSHEGWLGEPLAQAKLAYTEAVVRDMKKDEWDGEPLCIDALLAAAVHAGLDRAPAMVAAALDAPLDTCPQCETRLEWHGGAAGCPACGWDERSDPLTKPYDEAARAQAWLDHEGEEHEYGQTCLAVRALPLRADLPEPHRTLWLDATPTREVPALLFGLDTENVVVTGNEPRELNAEVTQITNGQYHRGTIARGTREGDDPDEYGERLRERFQTLIEARCRTCERVLVAGHKKNRRLFDLPDNAEWMHYHAGRGLDRSDYDAVVIVGAPHVPEDALRRDAELLAQGRDDVRGGGHEFGTRRNEQGELDANPPLYRKYHYEDDEGRGRAAPTKGYSGLMGTLFRASREDELLQIGHRVRPGQADPDETKHIDLLTNVPTELPVDELTDLETLTEPLYRQADLPEGVMDMSAAAADALDRRERGRGLIAGVRPSMLVTTDENGDLSMKAEGWRYLCRVYGVETRNGTTPSLSTIYDWLDRLDRLDLLRPEEYEQREGRTHSGSPATLNLALQYLSHNVNFKVGVARRFRRFVADGASAEVWLSLLAEAFDAGDGVSGGHPPPDPT